MNMLRRSQAASASERDAAIAALRRAEVVASDETGDRIEGSNAYQWVFRSSEAVVHRAATTRGAIVVHDLMEGHRPQVWCSDRYSAQQGHGGRTKPVSPISPGMSPISMRGATTCCHRGFASG
jgi:transposase